MSEEIIWVNVTFSINSIEQISACHNTIGNRDQRILEAVDIVRWELLPRSRIPSTEPQWQQSNSCCGGNKSFFWTAHVLSLPGGSWGEETGSELSSPGVFTSCVLHYKNKTVCPDGPIQISELHQYGACKMFLHVIPVTSQAWQLLIAGSLHRSVKKLQNMFVNVYEVWCKCINTNVFLKRRQ